MFQIFIKTILLFLTIDIIVSLWTFKEETTHVKVTKSQQHLSLCPLAMQQNFTSKRKKPLRVLAIDGGGVRGIIPARILAEMEKRSGKPASELFDLMVGNSTGGLIVLALNTPNESGQPKYKASDILELYNQKAKNIFKSSIFRKIYTGFGLFGPKYDRSEYDKVLVEFFGNIRMSQLVKPVAAISFNLNTELPDIWSREYARSKPHKDFLVSDIAAATSAAPTYFAPKLLTDILNNSEYQIDGGIFVNNPESVAISLALELDDKLTRDDIILISLATGQVKLGLNPVNLNKAGVIGWVIKANLIDVMMEAQSNWYDIEVGEVYLNSCRLQLELNKTTSALDNASEINLHSLVKLTDEYININSALIDHIIKILVW